ncbi:DNA-directed RNA polymerase, mitochondrial isoform X2 [Kryptolebias marmoratus]|uniref:DNA-directed RNA polymerase, mitochondrial isoform X2 n=1 Tax=Kryptolebias marmoratus TaxID=37003 RepID=UPI000D52FF5E|nr:DNA-directed RNA polymerase, mitochondrial isoform X2 [Kryptolebias marmoratus]
MSLLRACTFAKCFSRRSLLEKCALGQSFADYCRLCVSARNGAVRWISVLEARIQQLQSDVVLDVQHAKVQFVKVPSCRRGVSSGRIPTRGSLLEKTDIPKSGPSKGAYKSHPSRWMEKLFQEKKTKLRKLLHVQLNFQKSAEVLTVKPKGNKSSLKAASTTHKTISSASERKRSGKKVSDEICAALSAPTTVSLVTAEKTATTSKASKWKGSKQKSSNKDGKAETSIDSEATKMDLAEIEELHKRLNQRVPHWTVQDKPEISQDGTGSPCGDTHLSILAYLEACVFIGDIERSQNFLLSQHRVVSRRKHLTTDVYNIMMRVWAKKGTLHQVGRIFILLEEAGLKPNLGSYCAALECMGRNPNCFPNTILRCLKQMEEDGLSIDDLFSQCVFQHDERDLLLKAIHIIKPDYQPNLSLQTNQHYSPLVKDFYTQRENHSFPKLDFTQEDLQERFKRQLGVEEACTITIDSVEAVKPITADIAKMRALLAEQQAQWQKVLLQALGESKMILAKSNTKDHRLNLYPYLCLLEDREYVDIMIQSVSNLPPTGQSLRTLAKDLGNRVYTKYCVQQKHQNHTVEKLQTIYNAYTDLLAKDTKVCNVLPREQWCQLEVEQGIGPLLQGDKSSWPLIVTLDLGIYLVDLMVKNLKINSDILKPATGRKLIPILYHMYTFRSTQQIGFIKPHPILSQMQQGAMETKLTFDSYVMPMLCPPVPWTTVKFGAYLLTPTKLMRTIDGATHHKLLLEKCQNLHAVFDSLNQLGNCAWKINKPILDIIISIFNDRGSDKLDIPPPLSEAPKVPHFNPHDPAYTASEKANMKRQVISAKKKFNEMHSLRMDALYKLSIAHHMRDEIFWFPHNMDFRGRTYPCPPYFNHLGSDMTRAMLLFTEGKPLGPKGLDWLKIHLVNLTGLKKKSSLQGRLDYGNSILEDILDSAENPLNGKKWWMDADEPWQALACCMEIANAIRSPDPTQYISHFPIHQDGSCNGLQHYAALGRDVIGATSVNLMPCEVPQDVYSGVAQQVEEFRARDAANDTKIAQVLKGFINRKVVKQTVMTVVYGVTRYGGRLQIEKRLKETDDFPKDYVWEASHYLVRLVFSGLKEMFTGTREIQDWLTESARLISKSGHSVEWVTPLGLPIIQPYHRTRSKVVRNKMQNINLQITHDAKERPDTVKQKNAFPPNFIHSLDSTHMMLTSLHCHSAGLTFVSVHDCFWTHALTVDTMNKICREQFVALHSQPILQDLSNFMLQKYCAGLLTDSTGKKSKEYKKLMLLLTKVPETGDFDLHQVKESTYFFS